MSHNNHVTYYCYFTVKAVVKMNRSIYHTMRRFYNNNSGMQPPAWLLHHSTFICIIASLCNIVRIVYIIISRVFMFYVLPLCVLCTCGNSQWSIGSNPRPFSLKSNTQTTVRVTENHCSVCRLLRSTRGCQGPIFVSQLLWLCKT